MSSAPANRDQNELSLLKSRYSKLSGRAFQERLQSYGGTGHGCSGVNMGGLAVKQIILLKDHARNEAPVGVKRETGHKLLDGNLGESKVVANAMQYTLDPSSTSNMLLDSRGDGEELCGSIGCVGTTCHHTTICKAYCKALEDAIAVLNKISISANINCFPYFSTKFTGHSEYIIVNSARCSSLSTGVLHFSQLENCSKDKVSRLVDTKYGNNVIIANLDSGVWAESPSFNDEGLGPVPAKWKGKSIFNRKLIGYECFDFWNKKDLSETKADILGHGSHTLATAGGSFVKDAHFFGLDRGCIKGIASKSRVVSYKIMWGRFGDRISYEDVCNAFSKGIHDNVDIFSVSLGYSKEMQYRGDPIAMGSFWAMQHGRTVVCAAGNSGPNPATVVNGAPWIFTVGASVSDRRYVSSIYLENGKTFEGGSLSVSTLPKEKMYPVVLDLHARDSFEGKIVAHIYDSYETTKERLKRSAYIRKKGGVGLILINCAEMGNHIMEDKHCIPSTHLNAKDGAIVLSYIINTRFPKIYIGKTVTKYDARPAPTVANFSSAGPNLNTPDILKPDIIAPGGNILSAWPAIPATLYDARPVEFNLMSGTSSACPYVAGVVALLKEMYPKWSPAALRSAIMTTSSIVDGEGQAIKRQFTMEDATPFNYGAGHIDPEKATKPGLVYDVDLEDYITLLWSLNWSKIEIETITGQPFAPRPKIDIHNFNYPSICLSMLSGTTFVRRMLTYVSEGPTTFVAKVKSPYGVKVRVKPKCLHFTEKGEMKTFVLQIKINKSVIREGCAPYTFGHIIWEDGIHVVRSPIAVRIV